MATIPVNSSNPASAAFAALNGTEKAAASANSVSDQQNRFLTLLTTQLRNQDPLNPMDNAQMTSQLAQISTVDGIERLNATLKTLIDDSAQNQAVLAAGLVGHGALVPGSGLMLANSAGIGGFELAGSADNVAIEIKDANGLTVRTLRLDGQTAGVHAFTWDGKDDAGAQAADGAYTFQVAAKKGSDKVQADKLTLGMVDGIVRGANGITVDMGRLGSFAMADIKQIL